MLLLQCNASVLLALANLRFISASSFEHRLGVITLPSASRPLCLNPVLLDTRRGGGASALPMPTAAQPQQQEAADGCANGAVAATTVLLVRVRGAPPQHSATVAMRAALAGRLQE